MYRVNLGLPINEAKLLKYYYHFKQPEDDDINKVNENIVGLSYHTFVRLLLNQLISLLVLIRIYQKV